MPPALLSNLPWGRLIAPLLALGLVAALWFSQHNLSNAREKIDGLQASQKLLADELGVPSKDLLQALKALKETNNNRGAALKIINDKALIDKRNSDKADEALAKEQKQNQSAYSKSEATIDDLNNRKPEGGREAIEKDSQAPWKNWSLTGDDHVFSRPSWLNLSPKIQVVPHSDPERLKLAFIEAYQIDPALLRGSRVRGFVHFKDDVCYINVIDPTVYYDGGALGHELAHCLYGTWHDSRL